MIKYLMLVVVAMCLVGCSDKAAEQKAYAAGCSEGINTLLSSMGAAPNQDVIDKHCAETAAAYVAAKK